MIRLPPPPRGYDPQWATQLCALIEQQFRNTAQMNQAATFGMLDVSGLRIGGRVPRILFASTAVLGSDTWASTNTPHPFATAYPMPAASVAAGSVVRVRAAGVYGTASPAPTLTVQLAMGAVVMLATSAITPAGGGTNRGWTLDATLTCLAAGGAGSWEAQGMLWLGNAAANAKGVDAVALSNTAPVACATDVVQSIGLVTQWGTNNAANTITQRQLIVEILNP